MTSSCFESDSDSSVDSCSGVQRFTYEFKEKLRQNIKSNGKKQLELKRLGDSINKLQRNDKLKKGFVKRSKVIFDHLKKHIHSLGLGNIVERYIKYLPNNLYFISYFGQDGYDMNSTETRFFIQQAIERKGTQNMIAQQIKSLKTYNFAVKFGFNNDDDDYGMPYLKLLPHQQMLKAKKFIVKNMNEKNGKNGKQIYSVDDFYFKINGEELEDENKCISDIKFEDIDFEDEKKNYVVLHKNVLKAKVDVVLQKNVLKAKVVECKKVLVVEGKL